MPNYQGFTPKPEKSGSLEKVYQESSYLNENKWTDSMSLATRICHFCGMTCRNYYGAAERILLEVIVDYQSIPAIYQLLQLRLISKAPLTVMVSGAYYWVGYDSTSARTA